MTAPARKPLVTVAMPVYNGAETLERALGLVRSQTWSDLDIVVCDDASSDATPDICAVAAREDDRIRFFRHPHNLGMNANFNFGLREKRGEFFMWAGQDDEKLPRFVEEAVAALQRNPNAALACPWTTLVTRDGEHVHRPYSPPISDDRLERRLPAFVSDMHTVAIYGLFRSSVVDTVGPMKDWLDTDRHYLFNVAIRGSFEIVPEVLFRYRLIHSADDYIAMGMKMRPGATDFDLDLFRYFPKLLEDAGFDEGTVRRARSAMMVPLTPYLDRRASYLISRLLADASTPRREKLDLLAAWGRQYPPMRRTRMFWGAIRRIILGSRPT